MNEESVPTPPGGTPGYPSAQSEPTVLASRPLHEWNGVRGQVVRSDARVAELLLGFVRDTAAARNDPARLLDVIADYSFRAFPNASHHLLLAREDEHGALETLSARARDGARDESVGISRTIVERVMRDGCALLYAKSPGDIDPSQSIAMSRMETAICAPLMESREPFGVIEMDIRRPARGRFGREDVDLLSVFASQVGLALEHLRLHQQQRRAFESTINALVHSLTLKDPESAQHSERVQGLAVELGRRLGLNGEELEVLRVAALLHDLGKQGVRDEVLFKPDRLTDEERAEMATHAAHTQNILDRIIYPDDMHDVPRIASWHHEKLDGTGPFGIPGEDIPLTSRIISVADVFDALVSPRVYKLPLRPEQALAILDRGRDVDWDGRIVDEMAASLDQLVAAVYGRQPAAPEAEDEFPAAA